MAPGWGAGLVCYDICLATHKPFEARKLELIEFGFLQIPHTNCKLLKSGSPNTARIVAGYKFEIEIYCKANG